MQATVLLVVLVLLALWFIFANKHDSERFGSYVTDDVDGKYGNGAHGDYTRPYVEGYSHDPTVTSMSTLRYNPEYALALTHGDAHTSNSALANADSINAASVQPYV